MQTALIDLERTAYNSGAVPLCGSLGGPATTQSQSACWGQRVHRKPHARYPPRCNSSHRMNTNRYQTRLQKEVGSDSRPRCSMTRLWKGSPNSDSHPARSGLHRNSGDRSNHSPDREPTSHLSTGRMRAESRTFHTAMNGSGDEPRSWPSGCNHHTGGTAEPSQTRSKPPPWRPYRSHIEAPLKLISSLPLGPHHTSGN